MPPHPHFRVYDQILERAKPDTNLYPGMTRSRNMTKYHMTSPFGDEYDDNDPDYAYLVANLPGQFDYPPVTSLNVEHPPWEPHDWVRAQDHIYRYKVWGDAYSDSTPTVNGFYREIPKREFWTAVSGDAYARDHWRRLNQSNYPAFYGLDFVAPSLYFMVRPWDQAQYEAYIDNNIAEAQIYGKPVIAYVWPEYHGSIGGGRVETEAWLHMLNRVYQSGIEGMIIWTHPDNIPWDDQAEWWLETQKWLRDNNIGTRTSRNVVTAEVPAQLAQVGEGVAPEASAVEGLQIRNDVTCIAPFSSIGGLPNAGVLTNVQGQFRLDFHNDFSSLQDGTVVASIEDASRSNAIQARVSGTDLAFEIIRAGSTVVSETFAPAPGRGSVDIRFNLSETHGVTFILDSFRLDVDYTLPFAAVVDRINLVNVPLPDTNEIYHYHMCRVEVRNITGNTLQGWET